MVDPSLSSKDIPSEYGRHATALTSSLQLSFGELVVNFRPFASGISSVKKFTSYRQSPVDTTHSPFKVSGSGMGKIPDKAVVEIMIAPNKEINLGLTVLG